MRKNRYIIFFLLAGFAILFRDLQRTPSQYTDLGGSRLADVTRLAVGTKPCCTETHRWVLINSKAMPSEREIRCQKVTFEDGSGLRVGDTTHKMVQVLGTPHTSRESKNDTWSFEFYRGKCSEANFEIVCKDGNIQSITASPWQVLSCER